MKTIKPGDILTARSIGDYDCIFSAEVIERKGKMATVKVMGNVKRVKVRADGDSEYIFALGQYSMAPIFRGIEHHEGGIT